MCNITNYEYDILHVSVVGKDAYQTLKNVDMQGCQRRSAYDFQKERGIKVDFRCEGEHGPPCTVLIGNPLNFTATIQAGRNHHTIQMSYMHLICMFIYVLCLICT